MKKAALYLFAVLTIVVMACSCTDKHSKEDDDPTEELISLLKKANNKYEQGLDSLEMHELVIKTDSKIDKILDDFSSRETEEIFEDKELRRYMEEYENWASIVRGYPKYGDGSEGGSYTVDTAVYIAADEDIAEPEPKTYGDLSGIKQDVISLCYEAVYRINADPVYADAISEEINDRLDAIGVKLSEAERQELLHDADIRAANEAWIQAYNNAQSHKQATYEEPETEAAPEADLRTLQQYDNK